ncbi:cytochrome P450 family protein [Rhizoctonia solani]|uniref:Cytochrome P450 family protein n=1 Tax=Rhizoctonia solani TaxID=456999 RepID=A0A8H8SX46_9AGAM|nr:cytochrome P450 family protein [Rhizoctonia solani]QRW21014.1 cytochrome P450 family protein [Rhizoctonia solani]
MPLVGLYLPAPWLVFGGLVVLAINWLRCPTVLAKLPSPPGGNWLFGHFKSLVGAHGFEFQRGVFTTHGPTSVLKGFLGSQIIFTINPAIIHTVQIKEKDKFHCAKGPTIMVCSILGGGLLGLPSHKHRVQCKMPIFMGIAKEATGSINKELSLSQGSKEVNVFPWATAAALDLVGKAGLGYAFNLFAGDQNKYSTAIKSVTNDLASTAGRGRDIMTLLMKANESKGTNSYIDHKSMVGHMNVFIFAGHETTRCKEDTVLPLDYPLDTPSGKITSIPVRKGACVFLSNTFFNQNKLIWGKQAEEFLPERWIGKKIDEVTQTGSCLPGVYSSMMTFGLGSYACIGFKFAVMEIS